MNEKMDSDKCMYNKTTDAKKVMSIVAEKMLETRPREYVEYRPYIKNEGVNPRTNLRSLDIDLYKFHPDAVKGDVAFVTTMLTAAHNEMVKIVITGCVKVYLRDTLIYSSTGGNAPQFNYVDVELLKGYNELIIEAVCTGEDFSCSILPSMTFYRGMWAKDYLFVTRATSPVAEFEGEEGVAVSKLYKCVGDDDNNLLEAKETFEADGEKYIFPKPSQSDNIIEFDNIYANEKGCCAYALSYCIDACTIKICNYSPIKISVNGEVVFASDKTNTTVLNLEKNDVVLIRSVRDKSWGFKCESNGLGLPFVKSNRVNKNKWLLLGAFGLTPSLSILYAPDYGISFDHPYRNAEGKQCFWRFANENTYLRPYMDSFFFSQWYYALMVGHYGLAKAADMLDNQKYMDYFTDSIENMARYFEYMKYDQDSFGDTSFMQRARGLADWDNIGSMGMNMCDVYLHKQTSELLSAIERLAMAGESNINRFSDGTFNRVHTMWADDMFMSCPFLVRLGKVLHDDKYYAESVRQLKGYYDRLFMADKNLFSHIFFIDENTPNRVPWGRGNGWGIVAMTEVLMHLPDDFEGRNDILKIYRQFAEGIKNCQDENGMWHQVLDRKESYVETSATAMFTLGIARGIRYGWLDDEYIEVIKKSWNALCKNSIDVEGNIYGVCKGSGCNMQAEYYFTLDTVKNDDHGTGIVLAMAYELAKLGF